VSVLSSQAFDAALRQWLTRGPGSLACGGSRVSSARPAGAVITCAWQAAAPSPGPGAALPPPPLARWLISSGLEHWAQQVPGSFSGMTPQGQGLLLVPLHAQARDTVAALDEFLSSAVRALGVGAGEGRWDFRVIGPLEPGPGCEVRRELAQRGWPIS